MIIVKSKHGYFESAARGNNYWGAIDQAKKFPDLASVGLFFSPSFDFKATPIEILQMPAKPLSYLGFSRMMDSLDLDSIMKQSHNMPLASGISIYDNSEAWQGGAYTLRDVCRLYVGYLTPESAAELLSVAAYTGALNRYLLEIIGETDAKL